MALRTLRNKQEYETVYRHGRKIACEHAVVFCHLRAREVAETPGPRFGFVASRRVGNAVKRNRAKRLLREAVRQVLKDIEHHSNLWIVLVARSGITGQSSNEVRNELESALADAGLLARET